MLLKIGPGDIPRPIKGIGRVALPLLSEGSGIDKDHGATASCRLRREGKYPAVESLHTQVIFRLGAGKTGNVAALRQNDDVHALITPGEDLLHFRKDFLRTAVIGIIAGLDNAYLHGLFLLLDAAVKPQISEIQGKIRAHHHKIDAVKDQHVPLLSKACHIGLVNKL